MLSSIVEFGRHSRRYLLAGACLALVIARMIWPALNVDWISIILIIIAVAVIAAPRLKDMLPHIRSSLPYIRKLSVAGVEIELTEEVKNLGVNVDIAQARIAASGHINVAAEFEAGQSEVLEELKKDPRAALLLLAARIEQQVHLRLAKHGLRKQGEFVPVTRAIESGVASKVFPEEILDPFRKFWQIRNQIAHGMGFEVDNGLIISLISTGLNVLKLVSVE